MADKNIDDPQLGEDGNPIVVDDPSKKKKTAEEEFAEAVEKHTAERLKPIKSNLDKAYAARDEALKKLAEREKQDREAELKRLEEEGKYKEAAELRLKEEREARVAAESRIVALTRDMELKSVLAGIEFRNAKASSVAFLEIQSQLKQDASGNWVHSSGLGLKEAVEEFISKEENTFLLKPKISAGGGGGPIHGKPTNDSKSLFSMTQEEVMQMARDGKLRRK